MPNVTGYQLREALKAWRLRADTAAKQFNNNIFAFKNDEDVKNPVECAEKFAKADKAIATLESAQQYYNQQVQVKVEDKVLPLSLLVKMVGGAGRLEKMWRKAATDTGRDRYACRDTTRNVNEIHATRQVSIDDAIERADRAARRAGAIRAAIATGNAQEVLIDIDPELLD